MSSKTLTTSDGHVLLVSQAIGRISIGGVCDLSAAEARWLADSLRNAADEAAYFLHRRQVFEETMIVVGNLRDAVPNADKEEVHPEWVARWDSTTGVGAWSYNHRGCGPVEFTAAQQKRIRGGEFESPFPWGLP